MKNKLTISVLLIILLLSSFSISDKNDSINPTSLSDETIGFYQSSTCKISLIEFFLENQNGNFYFNANDYADIKCFGKITGVDKINDSYMVSIGTNTSINLFLQSSMWFLLLLFIPKIKSANRFSIKFLFLIPILLLLQYFGENKFYTKTNILHSIDPSIKNYYLIALLMFYSLCCLVLFDIFKDRYLNLVNYLPYVFLVVGTYSGMNLNIYLIIGSFFGIQSLLIDKKIKIPDYIYFLFSLVWIFNTNINEYFFDGDKLRGFSNSSYNILSQIFWILIFYLFLKGFLFLAKESKEYFDLEKFIKSLLITSSLVLTLGILGSRFSIINFFNFYVFGQNKRGMKTFESIAGNTWRGFSASAESIGEFYAFTILIFIFSLIYKKINYLSPYSLLLLPTFYGLYRTNNFAAFSSLVLIVMVLLFVNTDIFKRYRIYVLAGFGVVFFISTVLYLYVQDYDYISTELVYEATLHQDFYSNSNSYTSYLQVEQKMKERDLNSMLYNSENFKNASSSYVFIVQAFTQNFNIPLIPNIVAIISVISLLINRTEMWGIFIAKYSPNFLEAIFGNGPMQLNGYLYKHNIRLDVPEYKLEALFLPHSSFLDILIFFGVLGLLLLLGSIFYLFTKNKMFGMFKVLSIFLLINLLKSDSLLYINSLLLFVFSLSGIHYYENSDKDE
tara:strand:- start:1675 stop:3693 length:2019 start_codon:yes stop_codon:yes gene_type:complete